MGHGARQAERCGSLLKIDAVEFSAELDGEMRAKVINVKQCNQ